MTLRHLAYRWIVAVATLAAFATSATAAGRRYALLIGANDYQTVTKLQKAVGDAEALAASLSGFGYDVMLVRNPTRRQFNEAISTFAAKLTPEDTAIVHFSGHGVEIAQQNFLLPVDVPLPATGVTGAGADLVRSEAIGLSDLMSRVAASGVGVKIFIIDACRDNPFATRGVRSIGATRGLNTKEPTPEGTFVLYSAGIGQQALDRLGDKDLEPTSVYTRVLLRQFKAEGSVLATAKDLQREVRDMARRIGHVQQPAYYDEFIESESFYVDPLKNPKRGWSPLCASPPVAPTAEVWTHNGSTLFMVSDGNRRRLHYIDPRPVIRDNGVKPNCLLIDGEIVGTKFVGKAHIYRVQCGMFAYDVTGEYADGAVRLELNGPGPEPLFNCRVTRLDASSRNARLVFERVPAPPPQASTPVAPAQ